MSPFIRSAVTSGTDIERPAGCRDGDETGVCSPVVVRLGGLVARRVRWGLTWRGRLVCLVVLVALGLGGVRGIHPFLAVSALVDSPLVVVEGWVPPPVLEKVARRYADLPEVRITTTGGPVEEALNSTRVEDTSAAEAARILVELGMSSDRIVVVPCFVSRRDRTYASAVALREWFARQGVPVTAFTVVTEGTHARRSRLLFEAAFGPDVEIGVLSIPDHEYDASQWWRYSEGVKSVISETAAYLYARFLFEPEP